MSVERFAAGEPVLIGSAQDRTLFVATAAEAVDACKLERLHDLGRGIVVLAIDESIVDRLALPDTGAAGRFRIELPFTASIDAAGGIAGGWSLQDQSHTMRVAADPESRPKDLAIPGHVHPIRIPNDLLLARGDAAAASLELARASERMAAVALCAVLDSAGKPASLADALLDRNLARLPLAHTDEFRELARARAADELAVRCSLPLPLRVGRFEAFAHAEVHTGEAMIAIAHGDPAAHPRPLVYVHTACLLGDVFGSLLCTCHADLDRALSKIAGEQAGIVLYSKPEMALEAACAKRRPVDAAFAAGLLRHAGITALRIEGASSALAAQLHALGLDVERSASLQRAA